MTKTPQQLAKEYGDYFMPGEDNRAYTSVIKELAFLAGYEAGYNAAWDEWRAGKLFQNQDHADAVYKEAAEDHLSDAAKVMNPLNKSNSWISVKEQLPEDYVGWTTVYGCILSRWGVQPGFYTKDSKIWVSRFVDQDEDYHNYLPFESVTHWVPLPEAPKEEA